MQKRNAKVAASRPHLGRGLSGAHHFANNAAHAESYVVDGRRTDVRFACLIGPTKQQGHCGQVISQINGTLRFDDYALQRSQVTATVATASRAAGEPIVDALKGSDAFDVAALSRSTQSSERSTDGL